MAQADIRYTRSEDVSIAYEVFPGGPHRLVLVPGIISHLEVQHDFPGYRELTAGLSRFAEVAVFDKRGGGMSDHSAGSPSLEERMDDVRAVMDALGWERAVLVGNSEGGTMSALFAATYPERVSHLVLYGTTARFMPAPGYDGALTDSETWRDVLRNWGHGNSLRVFAPALADDPLHRELMAKLERHSASPGEFRNLLLMGMEIDIRPLLASIRVPTLVLHRTRDTVIPVSHGRYLAEHIPGARLVELPGEDHPIVAPDAGPIVAEVEKFVTGVPTPATADRVLGTVLFTDIVDSTGTAARLGDRAWSQVLDRHDEISRRELRGFGGRLVKQTGDGIHATFDGPARAVRCAVALREAVTGLGIHLRAGVHTGECVVRGGELEGVAVHIAARVAGMAGPGEVLVSGTVKDLVFGSGLRFSDRGSHELRGVPGRWALYAFAGAD